MTNIKMGLTIEEAAEMSGIGRNTMRKLVDWGKLPVLKVGRKTIIRRDALENFMPRRLRAKYTPRTNLAICTRGISLLRRACIDCSGRMPHIRYREKCCCIFLLLLRQSSVAFAAATASAVAKEDARRTKERR